jgi:zinc-binding alcohol dehydrogenase family protein
MKAVGYYKPLPITEPESLLDLELAEPVPTGRDLLVEVRAVSVNPVDTKIRKRNTPRGNDARVLGFDAAGVVKSTGKEVELFKPGDEVYYAGNNERPGSNAQLQLVDERIVGRKPASLSFAEAAALPLTAITAWELLFDRFKVTRGDQQPTGEIILIIGAAGGVGSILTQLARKLTGLTIIGTASRPETTGWVKSLGAHQVVNHGWPLPDELRRLGVSQVNYVASLTQTPLHFTEAAEVLAPQGKFGLIDDLGPNDIGLLRRKSISFHWEYMFTRPVFATPDMIAQHYLLDEVAKLVDAGVLRTTMKENYGKINAANLKKAHAMLESGQTIGKVVLEGW